MSVVGDDRRLLDALTPEDRRGLLALGRQRRLPRGAALVQEGDQSRFVALLTGGWVAASTSTQRGGRLILAIRGRGDVVGDLAALDDRPRSATVTALDTVSMIAMPGERFLGFLAGHPAAGLAYMRNLAARLRDSDAERRLLVSASVLQRLARLLVDLGDKEGLAGPDGVTLRPPLPQHELAASVGATREAVAKALRVLRERDIVRTGGRELVVRQRGLLGLLATTDLTTLPRV